MERLKPATLEEYYQHFDEPVKNLLLQVQKIIETVAPTGTKTISYSIPCFKLQGKPLIYFAAFKTHIGIYPVPVGIPELDEQFREYKTSGKGTLQIPLNRPLPSTLIMDIIRYRLSFIQQAVNKEHRKRTT